MKTYSVEMKIQAENLEDVRQKIKSLTALSEKLSTRELAKLEYTVLYDPVKTALAKTYLGL